VEGGVSIIGLRPNEKTMFFVPGREAYAFASEDCVLTLNGLKFRLAADEYLQLEPRIYEATATGPIIIQIVDFNPKADKHRIIDFHEALPAVETFGLAPADLELKSPTEATNVTYYMIYYMIGGAAAMVAAAVGALLYRRKSKPDER